MGKVAGWFKKVKNFIGNGVKKIGSGLKKLSNTVGNWGIVPDVLKNPLANSINMIGNSINSTGSAINGEISGKQWGNDQLNTFKHGVLAPVNAVKTMVDEGKKAKQQGKNFGQQIGAGVSKLAKDTGQFYKDFLNKAPNE